MEPTSFQVEFDTGGFDFPPGMRRFIDERIAKLEARTRKFPTRSCHISHQYTEREGMHRFVISLSLPHATLAAQSEESHPRTAFESGVKKVLLQLDESMAQLRRGDRPGSGPPPAGGR